MHKLLLALWLTACTTDPVALLEATPARTVRRATPAVAPLLGVVTMRAAEPVTTQVGRIFRRIVSRIGAHAGDARASDPPNLTIRFAVPSDRQRQVRIGAAIEFTVAGTDRPLRARVTSVSSDLGPPLDFALAEAEIVDAGAARDVPARTLGEVRTAAPRAVPTFADERPALAVTPSSSNTSPITARR